MKVSNRHRRWGGFPQNGDELRHAMGRSLVACCFRRYLWRYLGEIILQL